MSYQPGPEYPPDWLELSNRIKARDGWKCVECGSRDRLHVHHIIPISKGGTHDPSNLITLCWRCHAKKHPLLAEKIGVPIGGGNLLGTVALIGGIILCLIIWNWLYGCFQGPMHFCKDVRIAEFTKEDFLNPDYYLNDRAREVLSYWRYMIVETDAEKGYLRCSGGRVCYFSKGNEYPEGCRTVCYNWRNVCYSWQPCYDFY